MPGSPRTSRVEVRERVIGSTSTPPHRDGSYETVTLGSRVVLDDLDEGTAERYVIVLPAEASPGAGRLSNESPVARAIEGHHRGDLVDVRVPHGIRHLRITEVAIKDSAKRES